MGACFFAHAFTYLRTYYLTNTFVKSAIDLVVLLVLLVISDTIARTIAPCCTRAVRTVVSVGILILHEYIKEGYIYNIHDLNFTTLFPPSTHEAFIIYVVAASILLPARPRYKFMNK